MPQIPISDFVLTSKDAVGIMPPEAASGPGATVARWSSDGRTLVSFSQAFPRPPSRQLTLEELAASGNASQPIVWSYSVATGALTKIWSTRAPGASILDVQLFPGGKEALVTVAQDIAGSGESAGGSTIRSDDTRISVILLRLSSGTASEVFVGALGSNQAEVSPSRP
ncbi:MAG TPA: hypothetical protein VEX38_05600, partial [Fimbriimonadaceae bacterium]|nr:hypothetical protein [Fimbriimonadaceae bacterium]